MANAIEFFRAGEPTVMGEYPLDSDTGLDARAICWAGYKNGGMYFWVVLEGGISATLKLYRIDVGKTTAVRISSIRIAALTDVFYGITTDGTNLYILKTVLSGPTQNDPRIDVRRCSSPGVSILTVAAGPKEATPTDITFDGARLWWSYTLGGGLEAPPILACKLVSRLQSGEEHTMSDFQDVVGLEHTGSNTLRYSVGDATNIGLCLKKDGQQINLRPLVGSALAAHYKLCRFGRDDYAIVGA